MAVFMYSGSLKYFVHYRLYMMSEQLSYVTHNLILTLMSFHKYVHLA